MATARKSAGDFTGRTAVKQQADNKETLAKRAQEISIMAEIEAEEQAKRDAEVQQLITSKKYFVPLAHDSSKKHTSKAPAVIILILILLAAGAYAVVDLGLVKPGFDVPYHVLKK